MNDNLNEPEDTILVGDIRQRLRTIKDSTVDCVVTSPPYFRLRNYQHDGQLGLEETIDEWVSNLADAMDEVARLLKPTGTAWLNLGDSYSREEVVGAPPRVSSSLRNGYCWSSPNEAGESATASSGPSRIRCPPAFAIV